MQQWKFFSTEMYQNACFLLFIMLYKSSYYIPVKVYSTQQQCIYIQTMLTYRRISQYCFIGDKITAAHNTYMSQYAYKRKYFTTSMNVHVKQYLILYCHIMPKRAKSRLQARTPPKLSRKATCCTVQRRQRGSPIRCVLRYLTDAIYPSLQVVQRFKLSRCRHCVLAPACQKCHAFAYQYNYVYECTCRLV